MSDPKPFKHFERKAFTGGEIKIFIKEEMEKGLMPIWKEIGQALESLNNRISELEASVNTLIKERVEIKLQ